MFKALILFLTVWLLSAHTPSEKWLLWEQTNNIATFIQSTDFFDISYAEIDVAQVTVDAIDGVDPEIMKMIYSQDGQKVIFPKHRYNTNYALVPWTTLEDQGTWRSKHTASRSVVIFSKTDRTRMLFSIKLPTNHLLPQRPELGKAEMQNSVIISRKRSDLVKEIDQAIGKADDFEFMLDVVAVKHNKSRNGYVIRSLSAMKPGYHYLPAFSIPFDGRKIAELNHMTFEQFWGEHYAKALGRAKAQLLLRYGLQMNTPNAQNFLIELDVNFKPTGRILFRDISDTSFYRPIARQMDMAEKALSFEDDMGYPRAKELDPDARTSFWRFDQRGADVGFNILDKWVDIHNESFARYIIDELKLYDLIDEHSFFKGSYLRQLDDLLNRYDVQLRIEKYHQNKILSAIRLRLCRLHYLKFEL